MAESVLFYLFSLIAMVAGFFVVTARNPIASALSLVVCFFFLAADYVLLDAHFVAVIQVLVYAGAIMVLFIFVIMLLNLRPGVGPALDISPRALFGLAVAGIAVATGILILEAWALGRLQQEIQAAMDAQSVASVEAALTPLPMKAADWDARSTAPTDGAQAAFARAAADRLGTLKDVSITHRTAEGLTEPVIGVTFNVSGERANGFGHATFATQPGTLPPRLLLRSIELEVGGERRRLPEQVAEATPADPATAEQKEAK